jgi:DNA gyrase/topoisomerase IV subunit B
MINFLNRNIGYIVLISAILFLLTKSVNITKINNTQVNNNTILQDTITYMDTKFKFSKVNKDSLIYKSIN